MKTRHIAAIMIVLSAALAFGCANPADNKPRAIVSEPAESEMAPPDTADVQAAAQAEAPAPAPAPTSVLYTFAPESKIEWLGSKVTGKHDGGFERFTGEIDLVNNDPTASSVRVSIDIDSVWTDSNRLTGHLKTDDFFAAPTHPQATFASTGIVAEGDHYQVTGDLTLRGVTKSVTFPAKIHVADGSVHVESEFVLMRFDWGVAYTGRSNDLVRNEVVVKLNIAAVPAA